MTNIRKDAEKTSRALKKNKN